MISRAASAAAQSPDRLPRLIVGVTLGLLAAMLLWHTAALLNFVVWAIGYPYELDYGEGIVWQQMRLMFSGRAYGSIDGLSAIVFHYPPVYHALSHAIAGTTGVDGLAAGRTVSFAALLATAVAAGAIVHRLLRLEVDPKAALVGGSVASLAIMCNWPVLFWTPVMRVDLLSLAFSFGGAYCTILALKRPHFVYAAALAFVLAVYTKQSMIAAPAGCFAALLMLRPAMALRGITTACLLGAVLLGIFIWVTDGGFVQHLFLFNINRFDLRQLNPLLRLILIHSLYLAAAGLALRSRLPHLVRAVRNRSVQPEQGALLILLAYAGAAVLMLPLMAKSGSNVNYAIEAICLIATLAGLGAGDAANYISGRGKASPILAFATAACLLAQVLILPDEREDYLPPRTTQAELAQLSAMIKAADKPVISDDMVLLIRSGHEVVWEPAIFAELASVGIYDERPLLARIRNGEFAFFVTFMKRGDPTFDSRYNPRVADAMDIAYPLKTELAGFTVHLPTR